VNHWLRRAWILVAVASVVAIVTYLVVALLRIGHPYELQWMEGGSVDHVRRVLAGETIYPAPSVDFASFTYPPLYAWASAVVAWFTGTGFLPLRLVSLSASIGTMAVLAVVVRRRTDRWLPGLIAAGLFAAAFRATGAWYDVGRVDSLFVFLLVAAVAVIISTDTWRGAAVAGGLFALAAVTKQTGVIVAVPVGVFLLVRRPRIGLALLATFAAPLAVASVILNAGSDGWYRYETVDILLGHPVESRAWLSFPLSDIGLQLFPGIVLVVAALVLARRQPARSRPFAGVELVAVGSMIAGAWIARLHRGGYDDVLIPAFAGMALLIGLALGRLRPARPGPSLAIAGACVVQLALLAYNPLAQVPTSTDLAAGRSLVAAVRAVPGDVLVVSHPWYAVMAGKQPHVQAAAYFDIVRSRDPGARRRVEASVATAVREQRFAAIVFDTESDQRDFTPELAQYYKRIEAPALRAGEPGLWPVTDVEVRPSLWWIPIRR
jgi:hypothetical protein